jgi:hypothetical protein
MPQGCQLIGARECAGRVKKRVKTSGCEIHKKCDLHHHEWQVNLHAVLTIEIDRQIEFHTAKKSPAEAGP